MIKGILRKPSGRNRSKSRERRVTLPHRYPTQKRQIRMTVNKFNEMEKDMQDKVDEQTPIAIKIIDEIYSLPTSEWPRGNDEILHIFGEKFKNEDLDDNVIPVDDLLLWANEISRRRINELRSQRREEKNKEDEREEEKKAEECRKNTLCATAFLAAGGCAAVAGHYFLGGKKRGKTHKKSRRKPRRKPRRKSRRKPRRKKRRKKSRKKRQTRR